MKRKPILVHLDPSQKAALRRAQVRGTALAEEIRAAVDAYLAGVGPEELELLDWATARAERDLKAMAERLDVTNGRLDKLFVRLAG